MRNLIVTSTLLIGIAFLRIDLSAQTADFAGVIEKKDADYDKDKPWQTEEIKKRMKELRDYGLTNESLQYRLAKQGINPDDLRKLQSKGLDLKGIQTNLKDATYDALSVWYDGVVEGTIIGVEHDSTTNACFHTTYKVLVRNFEKRPQGLNANDSIINILQVSGPIGDGRRIETTSATSFRLGRSYLFFVSNSYLQYYMGSKTRPCTMEYDKYDFLVSEHSPYLGLSGQDIEYTCPSSHIPCTKFTYAEYKEDVLDKVRLIVGLLRH